MSPQRKDLIRMLVIGIAAAVLGTWGALQINWFPKQASTAAHKIDTLYDWLLVASVPMFVLVMAVAIYCVVRFRVRPGGPTGDGAPIHGNTRLEVIWVAVPTLIVTALAAYSWIVLSDVEAKQPNELQVRVISQQFAWHFQYPQYGKFTTDTLYLPKDRPVKFDVVTRDVLHSFWVPSFRLKTDAVPGMTTHLRLTPSRLGRYDVVCAELCGLGHSTMRQYATVVETPSFNTWINQQKSGAGSGGAGGSSASAGANTIPASG